ncbi:MAG: acetate--CoA ligase family protein [Actinomycetota bacterium]
MPTLSEADSKLLLSEHGVPIAAERIVDSASAAASAADDVGYPVVVKLNGDHIAHKTERGLVRLGVTSAADVRAASDDLLGAATPDDGDVSLLVAPMIKGSRELIVGLIDDPVFGPTVMLGLGGILAEAVADVVFRPAPVSADDAASMIADLRTAALLDAFRGEAPVDHQQLADVLIGLGGLAAARPDVRSVDLNPLIVQADGRLVAVDALVETGPSRAAANATRERPSDDAFRALFEPRGVVVTGASTHPGKFGFVSLHNLLAQGYDGAVYGTNLKGETVLGVDTVPSVADLPAGEIDLAFVCTPAATNPELLRQCADKGIRAAFLTSAGYGEAGEEGRAAERELVELADELGVLLAGPNGQGVVSTPVDLCAQIVAPYPPTGSIGIASQSGNFVSSFMNMARASGVGISRAVSAGNAAAVTVADYLEWYAADAATTVGLAYLEGITDGRALFDQLARAAAAQPLVIVKGGATEGGAQAAASHTGALAADDKVFDGACRAAGITRAASVTEAFETAATFATQPPSAGPNTVVLTTAGGWGVVTADAIARAPELELLQLPGDLQAAIDELLPPRWSKNNPVDCAGGETRDTIPAVLELIAAHPMVHNVIYLGLGIQSNQARMMRDGRFYPDHGLERIVAYHERQDARFAEAAAELSESTGKPILVATELATADPDNAGPAAVRASGRFCYPSGERAVAALAHLVADGSRRTR